MPKGVYTRPSLADRFWPKVDRKGPDECWPWIASKFGGNGLPYGQFQWKNRPHLAHRIAWILTHGELEPKVRVLHRCDNPPCCNPGHLFTGSDKDNMKDMASKGRGRLQRPFDRATGDRHGSRLHPERRPRGEGHKSSRLTEEQIRAIKDGYAAGTTQTELGKRYGVNQSHISAIVRGRRWTHIA